jgi:uncharacterized protein YdeI (BOF family)
MSQSDPQPSDRGTTPSSPFKTKPGALMAGIALAVLVVGAAAGAGGTRLAQRLQPQPVMLLQAGPIDKMQDDSQVAVKGNVAEIFGNKFIVQDESGRALVDLGPRGKNAPNAVTKGEPVTVQGRFDRGFIRAQVVAHANGRSEAFGPPGPPRHRERPPGSLGPRADRGPDRGPPPPPAAVDRGPVPPDALPPPRPQ